LTLLVASIDNITKTTAHAVHLLARDAKLQAVLREEVDLAVPSLLQDVTLQDLTTKLPRLKSFLHEVHRHYANPFLLLKAVRDLEFAGGTMPAGQHMLVMNHYIATRSPAAKVPTGPEGRYPADQFCPERYLVVGERGDLCCKTPASGPAFGGFGFGMRSCPGRLYAETLSMTVLTALLQNFEWTSAGETSDKLKYNGSCLMPVDPIQINVSLRKAHI
jgi:cytochrome P450